MVSNSLHGFARQSLESKISLLTKSQMIMERKHQLLEARISGLEESNQQLAADIQTRIASAKKFETITKQPRQSLESQISLLKESQLIMEKRHQQLEARLSRLEESNQQRADAIHIPSASATEGICSLCSASVNCCVHGTSSAIEQRQDEILGEGLEYLKEMLDEVPFENAGVGLRVNRNEAVENFERRLAGMEMLETQQRQVQDELRAELQKQKDQIHSLERNMSQVQSSEFLKGEDSTKSVNARMQGEHINAKIKKQEEKEEENGLDVDLGVREPDMPASVRYKGAPVERAHLEYKWAESMWDSSLFVGSSMLNTGASVAVVMCHIVYILVCVGWIHETHHSLTTPAYDDENERQLHIWRSTVAHDVMLRNSFTQESLARSVCSEKVSVPYSNLQTLMVVELNEYLQLREIVGMKWTAGSILAILVVLVWYFTLGKELRVVMDFLSGCSGLSIGKYTMFVPDSKDTSIVRLVSLSHVRAVYWMTTVFLRIVVVSLLACYGTLFLVYETFLRDMLMNAIGLELILNLDELIFAALLPKAPQILFEYILPLEYPTARKRCRHWNVYGQTLLLISVIGTSMAVVVSNVLDPFVQTLESNLEALCGGVPGSFDFVVAVDALGVPWAAAAQMESETMTYAMKTVLDVKKYGLQSLNNDLQPAERNNSGGFMHVATPDILQRHKTELGEFRFPTDWNLVEPNNIANVVGKNELHVLSHEDFGDMQGTVYNSVLRFLLGESNDVTCANVPLAFCYKHGSLRESLVFRKLCPAWCGCDSPEKGSVSNAWAKSQSYGYTGCSVFNTKRKKFVGKLKDQPCNDTESLAVFETWAQGVGNAVAPGRGLMIDALMSDFKEGGCDQVHKTDLGAGSGSKINICSETSLPVVCPVSCGCADELGWTPHHAMRFDYCPYSCYFAVRWALTIAVNHSSPTGTFGPLVDMPCSFPFKYQGVSYDECTCTDWPNPWCAVTLANDGSSYHWGDCPGSC